ncbi:hypothetical protein [Amycolatopsis sp. CA-126428]|nr:hypothetical protein [Amycolatopsis sp. CA-126428]
MSPLVLGQSYQNTGTRRCVGGAVTEDVITVAEDAIHPEGRKTGDESSV